MLKEEMPIGAVADLPTRGMTASQRRGITEEVIGESVTGAAGARGILGPDAVEIETADVIARIGEKDLEITDVGAELHDVLSFYPRQAVRKFVHQPVLKLGPAIVCLSVQSARPSSCIPTPTD